MRIVWIDGKMHIQVTDYSDREEVALALRYKANNPKARCDPKLFNAAASMIEDKEVVHE